jgi:UDP-N-acetylglucosamine--N-acetylmuramyl-(pentapeptide) pyrophosphoryl-undecaprenol N-acetylglucosamine transferase
MEACPELPDDAPLLLVFGGSRGAQAINTALCAALPLLPAGLRIIHQTGQADLETVQKAYADQGRREVRIEAFIDDMASVYRQAHLVVCRAGATTLAELAASGRPAVLIPYPHAAADHQSANARVMTEGGAAVMIAQQELTAKHLANTINTLLQDRNRLQQMAAAARLQAKSGAAAAILDVCRGLCRSAQRVN